jgi:AraC-like DNA-binding protein
MTEKAQKAQAKTDNIWNIYHFQENNLTESEKILNPVFLFVLSGNITLHIYGLEDIKLTDNEMIMLPDGWMYKIETITQSDLMTCQFPVELLYSEQKLLNELLVFNPEIQNNYKILPIKKTILRFLLLLSQCIKDGMVSDYFYELKRNELILLLFVYYKREDLAQFLRGILSNDFQFKKFVMNNYLTAKNVQGLASLANYSTSGFIKKFQKTFSESPYKWMQKQKARLILMDINRGKKSLQGIADDFGFSSYQHFSSFCRKYFNQPPTEIRK